MPITVSLYLVTLQKATPNPLLKESDEETAEGADKGKDDSKAQSKEEPKDQEKKTRMPSRSRQGRGQER